MGVLVNGDLLSVLSTADRSTFDLLSLYLLLIAALMTYWQYYLVSTADGSIENLLAMLSTAGYSIDDLQAMLSTAGYSIDDLQAMLSTADGSINDFLANAVYCCWENG